LGNAIPKDRNWDKVKSQLMFELLGAKFDQVPIFRRQLLGSCDSKLTHPVFNSYWGTGSDGQGDDMFGALLTQLREIQLAKTQTKTPPTTNAPNSQTQPMAQQIKTKPTSTNTPPPQFTSPKHTARKPTSQKHTTTTPQPLATQNRFQALSTNIPSQSPSTQHLHKSTHSIPSTSTTTQILTPPPQSPSKTAPPPKSHQPQSHKPTSISQSPQLHPSTSSSQTTTSTQIIPTTPTTTHSQQSSPSIPTPRKTLHLSPPASHSAEEFPPLSPTASVTASASAPTVSYAQKAKTQACAQETQGLSLRPFSRPMGCSPSHIYTLGPISSRPVALSRQVSVTPKRPLESPTHGPLGSPTHGAQVDKRTRNISPKSTCTDKAHNIRVVPHSSGRYKKMWQLPVIHKPILVVGDSNLRNITTTPTTDIQIECYPGANFRNITSIVKTYAHLEKPGKIILSVGINNRRAMPNNSSIPDLKNLISSTVKSFPNADIYIPTINYPGHLAPAEKQHLDAINKIINSHSKGSAIPKLNSNQFETKPWDIHWTNKTANTLLDHWLSHLN